MTPRHEGLFEDILVHACECGGLFMPPTSLDRLDDNIDVNTSSLRWSAAKRTDSLLCPRCPGGYRDGAPMLQGQIWPGRPEIRIHRCSGCSWLALDHPTLEAIRDEVVGLGRSGLTGK